MLLIFLNKIVWFFKNMIPIYSYSAIKVLKYDYRKINIVYENNKLNQLQ